MYARDDLEKELQETELADFQKIAAYGYEPSSFQRLAENRVAITLFEGNRVVLELSSRGYEVS